MRSSITSWKKQSTQCLGTSIDLYTRRGSMMAAGDGSYSRMGNGRAARGLGDLGRRGLPTASLSLDIRSRIVRAFFRRCQRRSRLRAVGLSQFAATELDGDRAQDVGAALGRLIAGEFVEFSRVARGFGRVVVVLRHPVDLKYLAQRFDSVLAVSFGNRSVRTVSRGCASIRRSAAEAAQHPADEEEDQEQDDERGDRASYPLSRREFAPRDPLKAAFAALAAVDWRRRR